MNFIKKEEQGKFVDEEGTKLFYINSNKAKEYESHMDVLHAIVEDYDRLKVYVINKEDCSGNVSGSDNKFQFELYEHKELLKSFVNCNIGTVTSFLRKYIGSRNANGQIKNNNDAEEESIEANTVKKIEYLLKSNKIILFMKGSKSFPQCKFSNAVVFILNSLKIKYNTYDILQDEHIRNQLKIYSNWPTYPQLYINSELIGGHDIIKSMYDSNELKGIIPQDCLEE
ncbi:glutaredoxin-like protein, putative [Plasmodium malariae]|uniref:Glutaredoxin-like protein (GLP2) n=2 Tax=Plasmodium (Plasmodium) TaxID=418103 RepID=A0A1A8XBJ4_PLAMA|nr:glutaredoxin-like protein, putative [Plasmodium malariae]SBT01229.1 glutaredoxin-like protein (GLP2) [Plasmodium malariae]SCO93307.1 glutaredoxin-like protein, putative [Plasmodium malariae]